MFGSKKDKKKDVKKPETKEEKEKKILMSMQSQGLVGIRDIKDNLVVLDDNFLSILKIKGINFHLLSAEEQARMMSAFGSFCNSLGFPVQIFLTIREATTNNYDIYEKFLSKKITEAKEKDDKKMAMLLDGYREYFYGMLKIRENIIIQDFYLVIPYYPPESDIFGKLSEILMSKKTTEVDNINKNQWDVIKKEMHQRKVLVMGGGGASLPMQELTREEIINLFYILFNPRTSKRYPLLNKQRTKADEK